VKLRRNNGEAAAGSARILFPFLGSNVSKRTLEAALRLAKAEEATLVLVYIASVPRSMALDSRLPSQCENAIPLLDAIEQKAAKAGVPVDSRIETGRTARHALERLMAEEDFERVVVPAATETSEGFHSDDIAWLLEKVPGEVLVIRPRATEPAIEIG
jgi:nucleotide-binding universal stress UspA family protein